MSADNAIYIRELPNHKFAVDCISSFYPDDLTDEQIDESFQNLETFDTLNEAWEEEERIQQQYDEDGNYIEYGTEVLLRKNKQ